MNNELTTLQKIEYFFDTLTFEHVLVPFIIILPVLMIIWYWLRKGHPILLPFDHGNQRKGLGLKIMINIAYMATPLICIIAILIAATPMENGIPQTTRKMKNIDICLDVSGSMKEPVNPNGDKEYRRYDMAKEQIARFIKIREGDAAGLTVFGQQTLPWIPLTKDPSGFLQIGQVIDPDWLPYEFMGTNIGMALTVSKRKLLNAPGDEEEEDPDEDEDDEEQDNISMTTTVDDRMVDSGDKLIILVSDGQSMDMYNRPDIAQQIADDLRDKGIVVYCILIAPKNGQMTEEMEIISSTTGGTAKLASDPETMQKIFDYIDEMQPAKFKQTAAMQVDIYRPFAVAGYLCLGLLMINLFILRYTPW